jgi:hypothetical protein
MQFIALIYQNENIQKNFSKEEWGKIYVEYQAVGKELTEKGQLLAGYGLQPTLAGKTVQSQEGRVSVQDGPAYRTEDSLSAVNVIEAPDMETALQIAGKFPSVRWGSIEVRPVMQYKSTSVETYKTVRA